MSSCWLLYNASICLFITKFSLSSDTVSPDVSLSFPSEELSILNRKKFLLYSTLHTILENLRSWSGPSKSV